MTTPEGPTGQHLSPGFSGAIRQFAYWVANGTVGTPLVKGIDYWDDMRDSPSLMEQVFAIFTNVLVSTPRATRSTQGGRAAGRHVDSPVLHQDRTGTAARGLGGPSVPTPADPVGADTEQGPRVPHSTHQDCDAYSASFRGFVPRQKIFLVGSASKGAFPTYHESRSRTTSSPYSARALLDAQSD